MKDMEDLIEDMTDEQYKEYVDQLEFEQRGCDHKTVHYGKTLFGQPEPKVLAKKFLSLKDIPIIGEYDVCGHCGLRLNTRLIH